MKHMPAYWLFAVHQLVHDIIACLQNWHVSIKDALDKTIDSVFEGKKDEAVYKVEHILFLMTQKQKLTTTQQNDAKNFFSMFGETLAKSNNAALTV